MSKNVRFNFRNKKLPLLLVVDNLVPQWKPYTWQNNQSKFKIQEKKYFTSQSQIWDFFFLQLMFGRFEEQTKWSESLKLPTGATLDMLFIFFYF